MLSRIRSFSVSGVGGFEIAVEVYISGGLPGFEIVGLPDAAVKEARERVRAAIKNNGFRFPPSRLTVNLAPADRKKAGTLYDLPILIGILTAQGELPRIAADCAFLGELALDGSLRRISGALPMAIAAERCGVKKLFLPAENASEAAFAEGVEVYGVESVGELVAHLRGEKELLPAAPPVLTASDLALPDFSDVKGQESVKRAFEVAAAGGHNMLCVGPPGSGKSMMARRLPSILPDMTREEMIEATEIHSVAGLTGSRNPIICTRPFRSPHHTVSGPGLSGGGTVPRPGEISLAHTGVLFLDELPEFRSDVLEVLRQPLEDGEVTVSRVAGSVTFPSRFMLVCAMNPCRCGWYGHPSGRCRCSPTDVKKYLSRLSGPLLDRIDLFVEVPPLEFQNLADRTPGESSASIRARVVAARARQTARFGETGPACNAGMGQEELRTCCGLDPAGQAIMKGAYEHMGLTARSYDRILRVARTIADLDGAEDIAPEHLAEAIQYRELAHFQQ